MKTNNPQIITTSLEETIALGERFAKSLRKGAIVCLVGELGGGKTSFVKGMAKGLKVESSRLVRSPSFTILNEYVGKLPLYHFDLYRLKDESELVELGIDEYLYGEGVCAVEWADKFSDFWPKDTISVEFELLSENERKITIKDRSKNASI